MGSGIRPSNLRGRVRISMAWLGSSGVMITLEGFAIWDKIIEFETVGVEIVDGVVPVGMVVTLGGVMVTGRVVTLVPVRAMRSLEVVVK